MLAGQQLFCSEAQISVVLDVDMGEEGTSTYMRQFVLAVGGRTTKEV